MGWRCAAVVGDSVALNVVAMASVSGCMLDRELGISDAVLLDSILHHERNVKDTGKEIAVVLHDVGVRSAVACASLCSRLPNK